VAEDDPARTARQLMRGAASAVLATSGEGGGPHAALVTPAVAADGAVLLLLSGLSEHTRQLGRDPRCAVLFQGAAGGVNPQTTPRVSVTGTAARTEDPALRARWLARHPYAEGYAGFGDFGLWRVVPSGGLMVLGFGRAHRLAAAAFLPAAGTGPDAAAALGRSAPPGLVAAAARALGGAEGDWRAAELSSDGIDLVEQGTGQVVFLPFARPCVTPEAVLDALRDAGHAALAK